MLRCLLQVVAEHEVTNKVTNKTESLVLRLLKADGHLTIGGLCERTGLSQSGVKKVLASLKARGLIVRGGSDKSGRWRTV